MDPSWIMAGSNVLGKALTPSPAAPSSAGSVTDQIFDNSGWTVATGWASATPAVKPAADLPAWAILGAVALVVLGWIRTA